MNLSSLARSPECENLLKFALEHEVSDDWETPPLLCHVNGRILSGQVALGEADTEMVVHLNRPDSSSRCSVHLSTLLALAMAYIKYQYEAVANALANQGQQVELDLSAKPEGVASRIMVYSSLVARYGINSEEAIRYHAKYSSDNDFLDGASSVRMSARMLTIIGEEEEAKILQQRRNSTKLADPEVAEPVKSS
jgi:hypothetical protein